MRMNSRDEKAGVAAGQFAAVVLLLVAVWLVYLRVTFHSLTRFMAVIDTCPLTFCDFANHYLPMGRHVFDRTGPVPGFLYTPFFALLVALVAQLSDTGAVIAWGVAQVGLTILLLVVPRRLVRRPGLAAAALYVFLFLSAFPVLHNFKWGQISVLVTLCVLGSLALWQRGHAVVAGFLLAFATSIKFYPAWFALALLLRRDWRALSAYAVFCALFLVAVPAVALGPHATLQFYLDVLAQLRVRADGMLNDVNSQSLEGLLTRLCYSAGSPWPTSLSLFEPVRWGVLAVALPSVWLSLRRAKGGEMRAFLILFCALPFVTPTSWPHYFVYLPAAFLYLLLGLPAGGLRRGLIVSLIAVAAVLSNVVFWQVWNNRVTYSYLGFLFWANALTLVALLLVLFWGRAQGRRSSRAAGAGRAGPGHGDRAGRRSRRATRRGSKR